MTVDAKWHYEQYIESSNQKDYEAAKSYFNKAIELDPHNTAYRIERGQLFYNQPDYEASRADYEIVIQLSNDSEEIVEAYAKLTYIGNHTKNYDLMVRSLTWLINNGHAEEHHFGRYILRGLVFAIMGEYNKAVADYSKVLEMRPDHFPTIEKRAIAYFHLGNYANTITDMTIVLSWNDIPEIVQEQAYHFRGFAYFRLGQFAESLHDANEVLQLKQLDLISDPADYYS